MAADRENVDAVIVGAGFSGLYQLYRLRELGLSTRVFETGDGVGGTWYWNRYPGARCDINSLSYSYSFSPELEQEWEWSEKYPTQPEVLRYLNHVAERFDLLRDITLSTRVISAHWDDQTARWTVGTDTGEVVTAQFLIMATGVLSVPKPPEIPGIERYQGRVHQTARWGKDDVRFDGLRVAVIGTGSSGVQSIPIIAQQAAELTVFQRTPNFSVPAGNRPLDPVEVTEMKADYRAYREAQRASGYGVPGEPPTELTMSVSDDEREAAFEAGWAKGEIIGVISCYVDTLIDQAANEKAAEFARAKIRAVVHDPELAEKLSPRSFAIGTKRICLDTGYYETFNRPNVHLVDVRATPLVEFTSRGLRTSEAEYELDAVVFATGFDAVTGALTSVDIRGLHGRPLAGEWSSGPRTYLGIAAAGFPNMFTITGPLSPSVLSNMVVSIEQHVEWVSDCISYLRDHDSAVIEATPEAEAAWVQHVAEVGALTLFPQADSWYMGANVPGKPRVFLPYLGGVGVYRDLCADVAAKGYEGFVLRPAREPAAAPAPA
jgi:cation diffusion facilitator CzcD-associated flavoprotein CzcO